MENHQVQLFVVKRRIIYVLIHFNHEKHEFDAKTLAWSFRNSVILEFVELLELEHEVQLFVVDKRVVYVFHTYQPWEKRI